MKTATRAETLVVDASVVIKWFVPEVHGEAARRLLDQSHQYIAPDLLFAETANTVWKKVRRGEFSAAIGRQLVRDLGRVAVETVPCRAIAVDAHALAVGTGRSVYDSMYLALAVRLNTRMITADERFVNAIGAFSNIAAHIQHVASVVA